MKRLIKKCIGYALIFGFTPPAFGYQWTVYNGLPQAALVQLNVSAQVMTQAIEPGSSALFNYNTQGGWHNILNMSGLCLTTISIQPIGSNQMERAHWATLADISFGKLLNNLSQATTTLKSWGLNILQTIIHACSSGTWVIAKDPESGQMVAIHKK